MAISAGELRGISQGTIGVTKSGLTSQQTSLQRMGINVRTRGGGGGQSRVSAEALKKAQEKAQAEAQRKAQEQARLDALKKAQEEAQRQAQLKAEQQRIEDLKIALVQKGATTKESFATEKATGEQIKYTTTIDPRTKERVFTRENLRTGEVSTRTFEKVGVGSTVAQTGGITTAPIKSDLTIQELQGFNKTGGMVFTAQESGLEEGQIGYIPSGETYQGQVLYSGEASSPVENVVPLPKYLTTPPKENLSDVFYKAPSGATTKEQIKGTIGGGFELVKFAALTPVVKFKELLSYTGEKEKEFSVKLYSESKDKSNIFGATGMYGSFLIGGAGVTSSAVSSVIPTTPVGIAETAIFIKGFSQLSTVTRIGAGASITAVEAKSFLDTSLTPQERLTSGIVGGLALTGTLFEVTPFIRGAKAQTIGRLTGEYKPTQTIENIEAIRGVKINEQLTDISIIQTGSPNLFIEGLPKESPLRTGAFNKSFKNQKVFEEVPISKQKLGTSQIGFFEEGKIIQLEREFYASPQEPTLQTPLARKSRLGLQTVFESNKNVEISFGLPKQPQIGIGIDTRGFKSGTTSELEVIKKSGQIKDIRKIGVTTINGQGIDIYTFTTEKGGTKTSSISGGKKGLSISTEGFTRVSGETLLSGVSRLRTTKITPTQSIIQPISTTTYKQKTTSISIPKSITTFPSQRISTKSTPSKISTGLTYPSKTTTKITTYSTKISKPITPQITTRISRKSQPTSYGKIPPTKPTEPNIIPPRLDFKPTKQPAPKTKGYSVAIRRRKKFFTIGKGLTLQQAQELGTQKAAGTLARTYKIGGLTGTQGLKTPRGFYTKQEKGATLFIEKGKYALSKTGEKREIKQAKRRKKK